MPDSVEDDDRLRRSPTQPPPDCRARRAVRTPGSEPMRRRRAAPALAALVAASLLALAGVGPRDAAEEMTESAPYACKGCGTAFDVQYHVCPECGGYSVEHRPDQGR